MHEKVNQVTYVAFTKEQASALRALAKARDWSIAKVVRYAVEKTIVAEKHDATAA